jgi:hypothetical protein
MPHNSDCREEDVILYSYWGARMDRRCRQDVLGLPKVAHRASSPCARGGLAQLGSLHRKALAESGARG